MDAATHGNMGLGDPEPLTEDEGGIGLIGMMSIVLVAGGVLLFVAAGMTTCTRGASRSARLRWEARQKAAEEAVRQIEAGRAAAEEPGRDAGGE